MAKKRFSIAPKLSDQKKEAPQPKKLPVQKISVEAIEQIAIGDKISTKKKEATPKEAEKTSKPTPTKKTSISETKKKKRPQGRPKRKEPVKRLSSDLPAELYDKVKVEISENGYSLNGFLAKVLRDYFAKK